MIRAIVKVPDPILTHHAMRVVGDISSLTKDLFDTCKANNGVGLAAPQIGIGLRVAVALVPGVAYGQVVLVNPVIVREEGEEVAEEGCLSMPGVLVRVSRATTISVMMHGITYEFFALNARIVQHEIDHLNGILITDRGEVVNG